MVPAATNMDSLCVNVIRGLAMDAVQAANSGHPGMPMGAAPMAHALWTRHLRHNPRNPKWFNRDRFILSAGHGSMLLYSLLHLTGYDLTLDDLKAFRQWGSRTPGHPENTLTPGVEMATGPLGQGISTAVGMAIAEAHLAATFNREGFPVVDHYTYGICSDGDLMEGVAQEACSLAGHLKLGKLIFLYDDNGITIDGKTDLAYSEDVTKKFESIGWQVLSCDGLDVEAVDRCLIEAKLETTKPTLIRCKTVIGFGSPSRAGTSKSHGEPLGADELKATKQALGLPEEQFYLPDEAVACYRQAIEAGAASQAQWESLVAQYSREHSEPADRFDRALLGNVREAVDALRPISEKAATRAANGKCVEMISPVLDGLLGGSADLTGNVFCGQTGYGVFSAEDRTGRTIHFGVREHAMMAAVNGITLHGGTRGFAGTFLIFSDYCKPSIRLAALMECPSIFIFTHDSVGVGEDGPTHQPIEQIAGLRAIPNLNLMRPADGNETVACWRLALESRKTPSLLALSRQALPSVTPAYAAGHPALQGGYVLRDTPDFAAVIVATGSEVHLAVGAAELLAAEGVPVRVVSLPSWFVFEQQDEAFQRSVLPWGVPTLSVEAASSFGWARYAQSHISIDRFGASAPGPVVLEQFGFTATAIAGRVRKLLG